MDFSEYQKKSRKTAIYPKQGNNFIYPALGLASESGEVIGKFKKILRDKNGLIDEADKDDLEKELGDVLWYLTQIATELNIDLDKIASGNIEKLLARQNKGTLMGEGDKR